MKFIVNIREVHILPVEVEAENETDAREKANDKLSTSDVNFDALEYSHTEGPEKWEVQNA